MGASSQLGEQRVYVGGSEGGTPGSSLRVVRAHGDELREGVSRVHLCVCVCVCVSVCVCECVCVCE